MFGWLLFRSGVARRRLRLTALTQTDHFQRSDDRAKMCLLPRTGCVFGKIVLERYLKTEEWFCLKVDSMETVFGMTTQSSLKRSYRLILDIPRFRFIHRSECHDAEFVLQGTIYFLLFL